MKYLQVLCCAVSVVLAPLLSNADQRSEVLDKKAMELYQQVFSPFCPGRSLNDCPSSKAHDLKLEMRTKLEQGTLPEDVLQEVFARFGDQYRAVPAYKGFGRLVWWIPLGFVALGLVLALIVGLGRRRGAQGASNAPACEAPRAVVTKEVQARIDRELSSFD